MLDIDRVLGLVDAGTGHYASFGCVGPIDSQWCHREGCSEVPVPGHDFCPDCAAWLRGDANDDPAPVRPLPTPPLADVSPPAGVDEDEWYAAIDAAIKEGGV